MANVIKNKLRANEKRYKIQTPGKWQTFQKIGSWQMANVIKNKLRANEQRYKKQTLGKWETLKK